LLEQAIAAANNDLSDQQNVTKEGVTLGRPGCIAAMLIAALGWLGCILALWWAVPWVAD
jgi:hypothetical protein